MHFTHGARYRKTGLPLIDRRCIGHAIPCLVPVNLPDACRAIGAIPKIHVVAPGIGRERRGQRKQTCGGRHFAVDRRDVCINSGLLSTLECGFILIFANPVQSKIEIVGSAPSGRDESGIRNMDVEGEQ